MAKGLSGSGEHSFSFLANSKEMSLRKSVVTAERLEHDALMYVHNCLHYHFVRYFRCHYTYCLFAICKPSNDPKYSLRKRRVRKSYRVS